MAGSCRSKGLEAGACFLGHGAGEEEEQELSRGSMPSPVDAQSSGLHVAVMFTEMPESPESSSSPSLPLPSSLPLSVSFSVSLSLLEPDFLRRNNFLI